MKKLIIILLFVSSILIIGCENGQENKFPKEKYCMEHITQLSCDELLQCYDECEEQSSLSWSNECREGYKARLWKCYGSSNQEGKNE